MAYIGLFFKTPEGILVTTYDKQEGESKAGMIIPPLGHEQVWRKAFQATYGEAYDFYPRGRVVYNTVSKQYVIYHDGCLKPYELEPVKEKFGLENEAVRMTVDLYYDCKRCRSLFEDEF